MEQNPTYINWRNLNAVAEKYKGMTSEEIRKTRRIERIPMYRTRISELQTQLAQLPPQDEARRKELTEELKARKSMLAEAESTQKE